MSLAVKRRRQAAAVGALLVAAAIVLAFVLQLRSERKDAAAAPENRPELLLLTSLPLVFAEELSLDGGGSPALDALNARFRVTPISTTDAATLAGKDLLLMAQPRAQPAEMLVALDEWVRNGGRLVLLADPMLEWPSSLPLGDVRRPPFAFPDTGLLQHWGLRLDSPETAGAREVAVAGGAVRARSPGTLVQIGPGCRIEESGLIARCRIGAGRAVIVADADFIGGGMRSDSDLEANLALLVAELEQAAR